MGRDNLPGGGSGSKLYWGPYDKGNTYTQYTDFKDADKTIPPAAVRAEELTGDNPLFAALA